MSYAGVIVFASVYLQRVAGFDPLVAGLAFLPSTLVTAFVAAPLTMPIARRHRRPRHGHRHGCDNGCRRGDAALHAARLCVSGSFLPRRASAAFGGMLAYQSGMIAGLAHVEDADEGSASAAQSFALQLGIGLGVAFGAAAQEARTSTILRAGSSAAEALAGGLQAAFFVSIVAGLAMMVAIIFGLRHAATAEIPLRHYCPSANCTIASPSEPSMESLRHRAARRAPPSSC